MPTYPPPPPASMSMFLPGYDFTPDGTTFVNSHVLQAISNLAPAKWFGLVYITSTSTPSPNVATHPEFAYCAWIPLDTGIIYFWTGSAWTPAFCQPQISNKSITLAKLAGPGAGDSLYILRVNLAGDGVEAVPLSTILTAGSVPLSAIATGTAGYVLTMSGGVASWQPSSITIPIAINQGGTGAVGRANAIRNLMPLASSDKTLVYYNGTDWVILNPGTSSQFLRGDMSWQTIGNPNNVGPIYGSQLLTNPIQGNVAVTPPGGSANLYVSSSSCVNTWYTAKLPAQFPVGVNNIYCTLYMLMPCTITPPSTGLGGVGINPTQLPSSLPYGVTGINPLGATTPPFNNPQFASTVFPTYSGGYLIPPPFLEGMQFRVTGGGGNPVQVLYGTWDGMLQCYKQLATAYPDLFGAFAVSGSYSWGLVYVFPNVVIPVAPATNQFDWYQIQYVNLNAGYVAAGPYLKITGYS